MVLDPRWGGRLALVAWCAVIVLVLLTGHAVDGKALLPAAQGDEPQLRLRATPRISFAGTEIVFMGELRGGADDYKEFYCAAVEWDWDDDTRSESTPDCDPYEPDTSKIRRRFTMRHVYQYGGRYEVRLRLKQRDDIVASARARVEVRGYRFR